MSGLWTSTADTPLSVPVTARHLYPDDTALGQLPYLYILYVHILYVHIPSGTPLRRPTRRKTTPASARGRTSCVTSLSICTECHI